MNCETTLPDEKYFIYWLNRIFTLIVELLSQFSIVEEARLWSSPERSDNIMVMRCERAVCGLCNHGSAGFTCLRLCLGAI